MRSNRTWRRDALALGGLAFVALGLASCRKPAADSKATANPPAADGQTLQVADNTQALTLAISTGPLQGARVDVPPGALPIGATLALGETAPPAEFDAATSADNPAASRPLQLVIVDAAGQAITAAGALTVTIPFDPTAATLTDANEGLIDVSALTATERSPANLVCLLRDAAAQLAFWRRDAFSTLDESGQLVQVHMMTGGTLQLAYAPVDAAVPGFAAANDRGMAIILSNVVCATGKSSFLPRAKDNASFKAFYELFYKCTCTVAGVSGANCTSAVQKGFAGTLCIATDSVASIDDKTVTASYDTALHALQASCDGTKIITSGPSTSATTATATGTGTAPKATHPGCQATTDLLCTEYFGASFDTLDQQAACDSGTYLPAGCPAANRSGICTIDGGMATERRQSFYPPGYPTQAAMGYCADETGTFAAP
jgi:hypothetical protein